MMEDYLYYDYEAEQEDKPQFKSREDWALNIRDRLMLKRNEMQDEESYELLDEACQALGILVSYIETKKVLHILDQQKLAKTVKELYELKAKI